VGHPRYAGLVLAAGAGRRFGGPKQLATLEGRPLLEHALRAMMAVPAIDPVLVVLGARADEILAGVALQGAEPLVIDGWEEGMAASLRAGVAAAEAAGADAVVVTLGDQPHITAQVIAAMLDHDTPRVAGVRAAYDGVPGLPALIKRALFAPVAELRGDAGARGVLATAKVRHVECGHLARPDDVDTPEQLEALGG
jgi:CTP:molybdopterin cytidylyltransferase MocA